MECKHVTTSCICNIWTAGPSAGRRLDVAFISAIVYFKKKLKKKARSLAGSVMKRQGGLEVAGVKSGLCT